MQFDTTINDWHTRPMSGRINGSNPCAEYMSLDDTACNLASLNLMKFRRADGEFDPERFTRAVDLVFTAQEILVGSTEYPTAKITTNAHANRELGIGYANLGALLMDRGLAYDSDEGRGYAAAITALMTGESFAQSARMAGVVGPYENYPKNQVGHDRVMEMHRLHAYRIRDEIVPADLLGAARQAWDDAVTIGKLNGFRNAQASVLAPTGCLVGDSLISTSRGLVRLRSLGDTDGAKWQALEHVDVATDGGPRRATQFYVNGSEQVVSVETSRGYRIQGTPSHRVKVVDPDGNWTWKRFAEIAVGDRVPLMLGSIVGDPIRVTLPPLGELHWNSGPRTRVPDNVTPALGEFVGYFMGDGSLHAKGLRMTVTAGDTDVIDRLVRLGDELFGIAGHVEDEGKGDVDIYFNSVPLTMWWQACGFAKHKPSPEHTGKGWTPHVPDVVLHTNDRDVYAAFVRGLFEADGTVSAGYASFSTVTESFTRDVQSLLLVLGFVTTRKVDEADSNWGTHVRYVLRLLNVAAATRFADEIGFVSRRKSERLLLGEHRQASRMDHIPVSRGMLDELAPDNDQLRKTMLMSLARRGDVSRRAAAALLERTADPDLEHLLGFFYDTVASRELLNDQPTFDLSVPDNVTYVANGFISHNTISFMMDCDTTGVEPDIALVKYKKLVGGGMLKLVNQTVPSALSKLGYTESQVTAITAYIEATGTIEGAPELADRHLSIFDCAFKPQNGTRTISHMGHIKMMGSVQPFISGAISKTVNLPETATVEDVMDAYIEAWKHGVKAIAIYRDGSKKVQPLSTGKESSNSRKETVTTLTETVIVPRPRRRLNDTRASLTHKFTIEGHEGYITVGLFEDNTPGELFVTMAKEGSTLSGMMDAFATSISLSLQYGVPMAHLVEKFAHMRFEPSGWTGNSELGFAKSIVDYVFRWLGYRFLSTEDKMAIGLVRTSEIVDPAPQLELLSKAVSMATPTVPSQETTWSEPPHTPRRMNSTPDAPPCPRCGWLTVRSGTCHKCENCGETTGCS
jgi:ribonucleoside-diphosphate reductase alpha chain